MNNGPAYFECNDERLNKAFRLAVGCVEANVAVIKHGLLTEEKPCVMAGLDYASPWTRDAAINVMNAVKYFDAEIAENTLLSVLTTDKDRVIVGDQYWDNVIWGLAAYELYCVNKDEKFLSLAYAALDNTLSDRINQEFDEKIGLFRGPAVYGDGVSAYPDKYTDADFNSGILSWVDSHADERAEKGYGLPMFALSTNCLYYAAMRTADTMAELLGKQTKYKAAADRLKNAVENKFFNGKSYDYLYNESSAQEGLGLSFLLLFDIVPKDRAEDIIKNVYVTKYGIPCVYPSFPRYNAYGFGRHSGTVWPHVQGFWAKAALKYENTQAFDRELFALADNAVKHMQFAEIYHPENGEIYGGVQEINAFGKKGIDLWKSCDYQTWSATAFLNMIFEGIAGYSTINGKFNPYLPDGIDYVKLNNFAVGNKRYDLNIKRSGDTVVFETAQRTNK